MEQMVEIGGVPLRVSMPEGGGSRRYPMILCLDGCLDLRPWVKLLGEEGVLPPVITATVMKSERTTDPLRFAEGLSRVFPILENPSARWLVGCGPSGVLALRTLLAHPEVFSAAASLSGSFEGPEGAPPAHSPMLLELEERTSLPNNVRFHADYGTVGLDECYEPYHRDLASLFRTKGWTSGREFLIQKVPGGAHELASWQQRLGEALRWLSGR